MAVHTLGSLEYKSLKFSENLWKGIDTSSVDNFVYDFYPAISRVTSKSENKAFAWLYGKIQVEGYGYVEVTYPYVDASDEILTLRNVSFSQFPYVLVKARGIETSNFKCWKDSVTGQVISEEMSILLTKDFYPESTGFVAEFEDNGDDLGF